MISRLIAILLLLPPLPAGAQTACAPYAKMLAGLAKVHGEVPQAMGLAQDRVVTVLVGPKRTWTILMAMPSGMSCVVAVGTNWEQGELVFLEEEDGL